MLCERLTGPRSLWLGLATHPNRGNYFVIRGRIIIFDDVGTFGVFDSNASDRKLKSQRGRYYIYIYMYVCMYIAINDLTITFVTV